MSLRSTVAHGGLGPAVRSAFPRSSLSCGTMGALVTVMLILDLESELGRGSSG